MDKKIIDSHRYKKVSRSKLKKEKTKKDYITRKISKNRSKVHPTNTMYSNNKYNNSNKTKNKNKCKNKFDLSKLVKIFTAILVIVGVVILSKLVFNKKNIELLSVFSNNDNIENEILVDNYNFNIGISKLDTTDYLKSSNVILNELANKSNLSLVNVNKDYKIEYYLADKIEKISDVSYIITLNAIYRSKADDIINSFNNIKNAGNSNIYYDKILNIKNIEKIDENNIKVNLLNSDPFFMYKLDFPVKQLEGKDTQYLMNDVTNNSISFSKNNSKSTLGVINLKNYTNTDDMVTSFRNGDIDMFTASSDSIMQLIGKREYNLKKYRDGETVFLLGNINSSLYKRKEVRQALAYAINRDEIVRNVDMKFSEVIDIPYIYSDVKYKYDLYAAENVLLLSGWKKTGGIYNKNEGYEYKKLELNLLVNKDDSTKSAIADNIKEMVEKIGIRINVHKLTESEINTKVSNGEYDIVLSTVYINDNPNIEYLYNYINVSDITNAAIESVKNSEFSNIEENVNNLKNTLSSEVACIGIMAKTTNVVYQKYIKGFEDIAYMKVFDNMESIGKIK